MIIDIDADSGFCFGVVRAITTAEKELENGETLYCLGDIVHNGNEVNRLSDKGLKTITHQELPGLQGKKVLLRAHGEPPQTYITAKENGIQIIDATCPVVLQLQQKIKKAYTSHPEAQIVIYGKIGHAEVVGLEGQTEGKAIIIESVKDLKKIDFHQPIILFSQTTKSVADFNTIVEEIKSSIEEGVSFEYHDTICRQVANRIPHIKDFASKYEVIVFVSGKKSSNGKILYNECLASNPRTHIISDIDEIDRAWFVGAESIGICGATSTPKWLMEKVANYIKQSNNK